MTYPPIHETVAYRDTNSSLGKSPSASRYSNTGLWLPSYVNLSDAQIRNVCEIVKLFFYGREDTAKPLARL